MNKQISLLNYATQLLGRQQVPYPIDTQTAAKLLDVTPSTLNRAKKFNKPYCRKIQGYLASAEFVKSLNRKDFWKVEFSNLGAEPNDRF